MTIFFVRSFLLRLTNENTSISFIIFPWSFVFVRSEVSLNFVSLRFISHDQIAEREKEKRMREFSLALSSSIRSFFGKEKKENNSFTEVFYYYHYRDERERERKRVIVIQIGKYQVLIHSMCTRKDKSTKTTLSSSYQRAQN